ncbi:tail assembly protein, partial [Salmonella enterica]|nr:tail assembly protein [Salmonella enterica]
MRLWRIHGMPARCSAFLTRILKLHFRLRRVPAPLTISILFTPAGASIPPTGVAQMLAPQAKSPAMHSADNGRQNTYFSSLENMAAQGNPVPLAYGDDRLPADFAGNH